MQWQTVEVAKTDAVTMAGETKTYELNEKGLITALMLHAKFTADSSQVDCTKERVLDWLSKIEVVGDDTDIIKSLTGRELAACNFFDLRRPIPERVSEVDGTVNEALLTIMFGPKMYDTEYMLDLSKWNKVELNITNDDSDTGNFFDAGTYSVHQLELKNSSITPKGYLKTYRAKNWTPSAAVDDYTEKVPEAHPIRKIFAVVVPTAVAKTAAYTNEAIDILSEIKLTYNSDDVVVFDHAIEFLMNQNAIDYGQVETVAEVAGNDNEYFDAFMAYTLGGSLVPLDAATQSTSSIAGLQNFPESRVQITEIGLSADQGCIASVSGMGYANAFVFDFDLSLDMMGLLDPAEMATVKVKMTSAASEGTIGLCFEQAKAY
ncbi:MAG: hypothetical protein SVV88_11670 [Pseudomonadota bacterium]|nr:hypothetical protein [Pseudomonadota bacterium]